VSGERYPVAEELIVLRCVKCHIQFGIPVAAYHALKRSSDRFCCPFEHGQSFAPGETDEEKIARLEKRIEDRDESIAMLRRRIAARDGVITKLRKRIGDG